MLTTNPFDDDKLREECGVFGIHGADSAAAVVALGLHALQHRGQEAAGITAFDGKEFHTHRAMGHVAGNFDRDDIMRQLQGGSSVGHVRYSTTGETALRNVQPLFADLSTGGFAVAHNGNISNATALKKVLVRRGSIFQSTSDTEVIIHLVATSSYRSLLDRFIDALKQIEGAYSLICLTAEGMIGCRDPLGIRPLVIGKLGDAHILASETVALDVVGAEFVRSVEPGELVIIRDEQLTSHRPFASQSARPCIFEYVYFSRPDSIVDGTSVYSVRKAIGAELARENPVEADLVIPVPDSGTPAAIGYAQESGIPFELGIIRSHYVGRTFIQPGDQVRHLGVKLRHDQPQDRADDARCRRDRSAHAYRQPADPAQLLLWRRHARTRQIARGADEHRPDGEFHKRRQPVFHLDRRPVSRARRSEAQRRCAAILRCLLYR
jgi:amidophosphoribosyltransferase